jgi:hypothetical protein
LIRRFSFRQTLAGSYELASTPGSEQPLTLNIAADRPRLLAPLSGRLDVAGEIDARGLADRRPVRGHLTAQRLALGSARYELELEDNQGRRLVLRARRESLSRVSGGLFDARGDRIARVELRLDYKAALGRLLV